MATRNSSSPYQISLSNEQRILSINHRLLRRVAERALQVEQVRAADISIAIVDDPRIHEINRQYLGHDYPTDVISFLLEQRSRASDPSPPRGSGKELSGEIIISAETALRESRGYGWNPADELTLYLVHGLLHLCGYDDLTKAEQRLMRARETEILALWKLVPHYREQPPSPKAKRKTPNKKPSRRSPPARR